MTLSMALTISGVSKSFPGTRALSDVSMAIPAGEIRALAGGNGSGKSTLVKLLAGVQPADAGELRLGSTVVAASKITPAIAAAAGVRVVHQDLGVFSDLSVAENLALGSGFKQDFGGRIRWRMQRKHAQHLLDRFHISASPNMQMNELSPSLQTLVAIARALQDRAEGKGKILILDEPTAALPEHEVDDLLDALRRYAAGGEAILYISHRLGEVLDIADRITVLQDGIVAGTFDANQLDEHTLSEHIVAGKVDSVLRHPEPVNKDAGVVLRVSGVAVGPLRDISFTVRRGEIVGLAGLLGSGRSELLRAIFGDLEIGAGVIEVDGAPVGRGGIRAAIASGVGFVPEERRREASFEDMPVYTNILAPNVRSFWRQGRLDEGGMRERGREAMRRFSVKAASERSPLSTLSGGNQQKTIMARWLGMNRKLLLLDEPTQGVDVGARSEIYRLIDETARAGVGTVVVASDLEELAEVVHRALVIREGRIVAEFTRADLSAAQLTAQTTQRGA